MMKDSLAVLASLKPFQRHTVEYVYRRMYKDSSPAMKFLIADEVGLGKTLVAKGIIAKTIEKMQQDGKAAKPEQGASRALARKAT